jgi:undecaprenyl-diphosphatase
MGGFHILDYPVSRRRQVVGARIVHCSSDMERTTIRSERRDWILVVILGALALLGFAKVGQDVFAHESIGFDTAIRSWVAAHQSPGVFSFFYWVTTIGATRSMYILAFLTALYFWHRDRELVAASVLVAPALAVALYETVKRLYGRARPPGFNRALDTSFSFPSAHATAAAAVCCTITYVLWRENLLGRVTALLLAILVPLLIGVSRIYLDAHWATDVLGGWSAGLFIAALSAGLYNRARRHHRAKVGNA